MNPTQTAAIMTNVVMSQMICLNSAMETIIFILIPNLVVLKKASKLLSHYH